MLLNLFLFSRTLCTLYLTGTQASGAYIDMAGSSLHNCLHTLYIGFPSSVGQLVGVGHLVAERHTLAADLTLCHETHLLQYVKKRPCIILQQILPENASVFSHFFKKIFSTVKNDGISGKSLLAKGKTGRNCAKSLALPVSLQYNIKSNCDRRAVFPGVISGKCPRNGGIIWVSCQLKDYCSILSA